MWGKSGQRPALARNGRPSSPLGAASPNTRRHTRSRSNPSWPTGRSPGLPCLAPALRPVAGKVPLVARTRIRNLCAALLGGVLAATLITSPAAAADPTTHHRAGAAAGWLARQLVDGDHFEVDFGGQTFPNQGLTIDAVFAFAAAKVADGHAAAAMQWLAQPDILTGYIGDGAVESYAGATAKLALAVQVRGNDPTSFGGVDLIDRLRDLEQPSGRFRDQSQFGDFSNMFGQSLAILALERTSGGAPATAVSFLAGSQCPDGGFPIQFDQPTCTSEVDATAMAVPALIAAGRSGAAAAGLDWLVSVQQADGGFASADGTVNANSTGLAGQALRAGWRIFAAAKAKRFLVGLQVGCDGPAADRGAVAFTAGGFDPATATLATAQAVLGMAGAGFPHLTAAGSRSTAPILACS